MRKTNETSAKRVPLWDLVGMALTLDKRLIVVLPLMYLVASALGKARGLDGFAQAFYAMPRLLVHWVEIAWAWI